MLKQKRFWLGLLISLILVIFVIYQTEPAKIWTALQRAQYIYLLPALALYFIGVGVRAARWHFLLRPIKPIPARALFPPVVIGYMANDILPARMGELVRAYVLGRQENVSKTATLVTIVVERLFDALIMLTFIVAGTFVLQLADEDLNARLRVLGALFLAAILAFAFLAGMPRHVERVANFFIERIPAALRARAHALTRALLDGLGVLRSPADSLAVFALSLLAWLFETGMYVVIAWGFNLFLPLPIFLVVCAVANLATLAPSTPGYIGVFHAAVLYVLATLFGVEANLATSYAIVLHAALIVPVTLLGFFYLWRAGISLTQMTRA